MVGACWKLGGLGESCPVVCGGLVDAPLSVALGSSTEVVEALALRAGLSTPRPTAAFDRTCEARPESSYRTALFLYFPEVEIWDCFPGESLEAIAPVFRAGCACLPPPAPGAPAPPPSAPAWYSGYCNSVGCAATASLVVGFTLALCLVFVLRYCRQDRGSYYSGYRGYRGSSFDDHYGRGNSYNGYYQRLPGMCSRHCFELSFQLQRLCRWLSYQLQRCMWCVTSCWCCRRRDDYLYPYGGDYGGGGYYGDSWKSAVSSPRGGQVRTSPNGALGYGGGGGEWQRRPRLSELDGSTGYLYPGSYPGSARRLRGDDFVRNKFDESYLSAPSTPHRPLSALTPRRYSGGYSSDPAIGGRPFTVADVHAAFDRFDTNRSDRLDYKELRTALSSFGLSVDSTEARAILQQYDGDGNGLLDIDEFRRLVERLYDLNGLDRSRAGAVTSPAVAAAGLDGGGVYGACVGIGAAPRPASMGAAAGFSSSGGGGMGASSRWSESEVRAAFDRFDTNRSGRLDYKELRKALNALGGLSVDGQEATAILQQYDGDGNGLLDIDEFRRLVERLSALGALPSAPPPSTGSGGSRVPGRAFRASSLATPTRNLASFEERSMPELGQRGCAAANQPRSVGGGTIWGGAGPPPPGKEKPPSQIFFPPASRANGVLNNLY